MPVTWCYQVEGQAQPVCERGFPLGCYVTKTSKRKDTCRLNVSIHIYFIPMKSESSEKLTIYMGGHIYIYIYGRAVAQWYRS